MCCHRRCGKTVAIANHLIRAASRNTRKWPPPRYGYVGPGFDQAKDLVWSYLKQYTEAIPGVEHYEGELKVVLPNGATIKLYGGMGSYQRMRGMYFDAANFHAPALRAAVETYGAGRILAGSDFPYFQEKKYVRAFDYIRDAGFAPETAAAILRGNAADLYSL